VPLVALLDANELYSAVLRDTLLRAAEEGLYRPVFTDQILSEVLRALTRNRPDLDPDRLGSMVQRVRDSFPEALVTGYESLVGVMTNDFGDRHVLAAAVRAHAAVIVTENGADFSLESRLPYDIDVQTADEFLTHLWTLDPDKMLRILDEQAAALTNPPTDVTGILTALKQHAPTFAATVVDRVLIDL
jgi:predicted nucleic acid-binding protein